MKIMYVHGFGSSFSETGSSKIEILKTIGEVVGLSYDYTATVAKNIAALSAFAISEKVDLIVGTSLGGFYASHLGDKLGLPVVLINPCVNPKIQLRKYLGNGKDYYGKPFELKEETLDSYGDFNTSAFGLVLLDRADDVIDHKDIDKLVHDFTVVRFDGGSHRFDHMKESLDYIVNHFHISEVVFGLQTD